MHRCPIASDGLPFRSVAVGSRFCYKSPSQSSKANPKCQCSRRFGLVVVAVVVVGAHCVCDAMRVNIKNCSHYSDSR